MKEVALLLVRNLKLSSFPLSFSGVIKGEV